MHWCGATCAMEIAISGPPLGSRASLSAASRRRLKPVTREARRRQAVRLLSSVAACAHSNTTEPREKPARPIHVVAIVLTEPLDQLGFLRAGSDDEEQEGHCAGGEDKTISGRQRGCEGGERKGHE